MIILTVSLRTKFKYQRFPVFPRNAIIYIHSFAVGRFANSVRPGPPRSLELGKTLEHFTSLIDFYPIS